MADMLTIEVEGSSRHSLPSLAQVRAVIEFMQKHPDLASKKLRYGMSHEKFRKLWIELSNMANSLEGAVKSTKGWIKFWSDKRRCIKLKQKRIEDGKTQDKITPLEQQILDLCFDDKSSSTRKKKALKQEPCNGDDDDSVDFYRKSEDMEFNQTDRLYATESDERQISMMEKLVDVMDQQASAMSQMAHASLDHSKALERLAEASHVQALAVDRLASTFEGVTAAVHEVRNAVMSIDYTMKRCYSSTPTQHRQNSNIFS